MYNGMIHAVELKCRNHLMNVIVDRFGEDVVTRWADDQHFIAAVDVSASPTFYSWLFTFAGEISVVSPAEVKEEYGKMAKKVLADSLGTENE